VTNELHSFARCRNASGASIARRDASRFSTAVDELIDVKDGVKRDSGIGQPMIAAFSAIHYASGMFDDAACPSHFGDCL